MAYWDQASLSTDNDFTMRIAAAATVEIELGDTTALTWATDHQWQIAAAPGFADKYAYAVETGVPYPGRDNAVISDLEILSAIQALPPENPV